MRRFFASHCRPSLVSQTFRFKILVESMSFEAF